MCRYSDSSVAAQSAREEAAIAADLLCFCGLIGSPATICPNRLLATLHQLLPQHIRALDADAATKSKLDYPAHSATATKAL